MSYSQKFEYLGYTVTIAGLGKSPVYSAPIEYVISKGEEIVFSQDGFHSAGDAVSAAKANIHQRFVINPATQRAMRIASVGISEEELRKTLANESYQPKVSIRVESSGVSPC
jgi:hypothetical protein